MVWYQDRWPTEVDNFYLKTRLGLADYRMQCFEAIEKFHAIVFLALAYLQYRLGQSLAVAHQTGLLCSNEQLRTLADVIRLHRAEHDIQLLKAACQLAMQHNSLAPVLTKFLHPFSAITSRFDEVTMMLTYLLFFPESSKNNLFCVCGGKCSP